MRIINLATVYLVIWAVLCALHSCGGSDMRINKEFWVAAVVCWMFAACLIALEVTK